MIKHFGEKAKSTLLRLFNESWRQGKVPSSWKKAHIIPIHKKREKQERPRELPAHQPHQLSGETDGTDPQ